MFIIVVYFELSPIALDTTFQKRIIVESEFMLILRATYSDSFVKRGVYICNFWIHNKGKLDTVTI